jgi:hypothetical protein
MQRQLGPFETALTLTGEHAPFVVVAVLRLAGAPPRERLAEALDLLARHYPMLSSRIVPRGRGFAFEPGEGVQVPLTVLPRKGEDHWREVADGELNTPVDHASGPLLRAAYLVPGESPGASGLEAESEIVLTFDHAAMDAVSAAPLLEQLLGLLGAADSEDLAARARELPESLPMPAVEERLPPAWRGLGGGGRRFRFLAKQMAEEISFRLATRRGRQAPVVKSTPCHPLPLLLDEATTEALVASTRRHRVTVHGALQAALLLALWRGVYEARPRPLRYIAFADLRPYLRPPLPREALGSAITFVRYTTRLESDTGFWPLAEEVSRQVHQGGHRGDKFASFLLSETMMRLTLRRGRDRMGETAVSYSGALDLGLAGAGRLRGLHAFVSNLALGPELTAQARITNGRLGIDLVYLDCDFDPCTLEPVAEEILALLRRAAES